MRLECVATYHLFGNVMSLQYVSFIGSQRDSLLISFKDAKLSIVEYELDTNSLHTVSLHYFEEEEIQVRYPIINEFTKVKFPLSWHRFNMWNFL